MVNRLTILQVNAKDNQIIVDFECEGRIRKFFLTNRFYAKYNQNIESVPEAILVIPFLSTVLPIVWANQADIFVNKIDQKFLEAVQNYRKSLNNFYPNLALNGYIHCKEVQSLPNVSQSKSMMLFSGGVDALTTYILHSEESPTLMCIHGGDIDPDNDVAWKNVKKAVIEFSDKKGCSFRFVTSNFRSMLDFLMLKIFDKYIYDKDGWFGRVMHGLAYLGMCAPIAYTEKNEKLYIASSYTEKFLGGWGSHPSLDNKIKWTGTSVIHDGYHLSRQDKLDVIANYLKNESEQLIIRSCFLSNNGGNCNKCEKCSRTIIGLELSGLDPNNHGFKVDENTFDSIKNNLMSGGWVFGDDQRFMWGDIKSNSLKKENIIHPNAKQFVNWIENLDIDSLPSVNRKPDVQKVIVPIFWVMPNKLYPVTKKVYYFVAEVLKQLKIQNRILLF